MSDKSGWDLLLDVMADSYICEVQRDATTDFAPTKRYQKWVKKNIYKYDKRVFPRSFGQRVAIIALSCLLAFGCLATVSAACEPIRDFFTRVIGEWLRVGHADDAVQSAPDTIEELGLPEYLPEGYDLKEQSIYDSFAVTVWELPSGENIRLEQWVREASFNYKAENTFELMAGDNLVLYHWFENHHIYYWTTEKYQFELKVTGELSLETVEQIICSVK